LPLLSQPVQDRPFAYLFRDLWRYLLSLLGLIPFLARDDSRRQTSLLTYGNRMLQEIPSGLDLRRWPIIRADERPSWWSSGSSFGWRWLGHTGRRSVGSFLQPSGRPLCR
jgi:hypothetical protein